MQRSLNRKVRVVILPNCVKYVTLKYFFIFKFLVSSTFIRIESSIIWVRGNAELYSCGPIGRENASEGSLLAITPDNIDRRHHTRERNFTYPNRHPGQCLVQQFRIILLGRVRAYMHCGLVWASRQHQSKADST